MTDGRRGGRADTVREKSVHSELKNHGEHGRSCATLRILEPG